MVSPLVSAYEKLSQLMMSYRDMGRWGDRVISRAFIRQLRREIKLMILEAIRVVKQLRMLRVLSHNAAATVANRWGANWGVSPALGYNEVLEMTLFVPCYSSPSLEEFDWGDGPVRLFSCWNVQEIGLFNSDEELWSSRQREIDGKDQHTGPYMRVS